jgi:competence protein ComEC
VIVGLNPLVIDEASFQLSFTAVLLLCTFEPLFSDRIYPAARQRLRKIPSPILHKLALTLFASLVLGTGMLPLVAYHFNLVSLVFPIANLVVVPILSLVLASGFACLLVGFLWVKAAAVFGLVAEAFAWTIFATVKLCSMLPASSLRVGSPPVWTLGLGAVGITLVWWRARLSHKLMTFAAVAGILVAMAFTGNRLSGNVLRATFLDVGDADSCLIEFPGGETMLVDTGFAALSFDCGEQVVAPFLWRKGITEIGTLVLTHPDSDHTGGALFLAKNFRIGRLIVADLAETPPEFSEILRVAGERGFRVEAVGAGDVIPGIEDVRVEALNPPHGASRGSFSDNETSIVLRVTYGETSLLLTGDAEKKALRFLTDLGEELGSRVLKAPHHGLANSFSKRFVKMVGPELVVISGTAYRANESIEDRTARYAPLCGRVFSTQNSGAITIESDGRSLKTGTTRKQRAELF